MAEHVGICPFSVDGNRGTVSRWQELRKGTVTELKKHGMAVQIEKGITGFVHGSELSWTSRWKNPATVYHVGDEVEVRVLEANEAKQLLVLSVKQTSENPWSKLRRRTTREPSARARSRRLLKKARSSGYPRISRGFSRVAA